jgi:AGCS family alanine or glycine:cation symporter
MFIFDVLDKLNYIFWGYFGFSIIALLGCYFTIKTRFFQIREMPSLFILFFRFLKFRKKTKVGTHPLQVFFASVGGMLGVGNIVGIVTALQIGGPGAIFWVWVAAFLGSILKYSEVYLGLKYRRKNKEGGYDGGPMYFLQKAFNKKWIASLVCILLCIYGAEIYQFSVLTHSISTSWNINHSLVVVLLLALVLYSAIGGIKRVGKICSGVIPLFAVVYVSMCFYIIGSHIQEIPALIASVIRAAFTGSAATGGAIGGGILLALQQGISRSVYSSDVGVGYDSIIQSESSADQIDHQARLAMLGVFFDNFICTLSLLIALITGFWKMTQADPYLIVEKGLSLYFPGQAIFLPLFLFVLVYTTLISYLYVGMKCAHFLNGRFGKKVYLFFSSIFFLVFAFFDSSKALLIMSLSGCLLLCINLLGVWRLKKEIDFSSFTFREEEEKKVTLTEGKETV